MSFSSQSKNKFEKYILTLSPIKQLIYEVINRNSKPQSAYKLLDAIKSKIPNAKPMMVYRALSFLEEEGLIHRIKSTATYHSCKNAIHKGAALFLICQKCGRVEELDLEQPILKALDKLANTVGFKFSNTCEIAGECGLCQQH